MNNLKSHEENIKSLVNKYDRVALVLQGGGALGSYQAGVYEGLAELGIQPNRICGISIGALNTAIIAGNAPEDRVSALRNFWETICKTNASIYDFGIVNDWINNLDPQLRKMFSAVAATRAMMEGQQGFFKPRVSTPMPFVSYNPSQLSYYTIDNLRNTLNEFVDFDRINSGEIHVSVGAVNIRTGHLHYFDNTRMELRAEHFIASGALPPGFPAVEIDGEYYWDGGIVSNTPLEKILTDKEKSNTLVFQVDLWSAEGVLPQTMMDVSERGKDIQYSSRTKLVTHFMSEQQKNKKLLKEILKHIPSEIKEKDSWCRRALKQAEDVRTNVIQLIYQNKNFEGHYKDYEFSTSTLLEHWSSGLTDIRQTMQNENWLIMPSSEEGFITHDIHKKTSVRAKAKSAITFERSEEDFDLEKEYGYAFKETENTDFPIYEDFFNENMDLPKIEKEVSKKIVENKKSVSIEDINSKTPFLKDLNVKSREEVAQNFMKHKWKKIIKNLKNKLIFNMTMLNK